jgi:nitrogen fixation NifU-like protein
MYTDAVRNHFTNPRNVGVLDEPDGHGRAKSEVHNDLLEMQIKVDGGAIRDVRYRVHGCAAAIASASAYSEMIKGLAIEDALAITAEDIADELGGLPEAKIRCSVLGPAALREAVEDHRTREVTA